MPGALVVALEPEVLDIVRDSLVSAGYDLSIAGSIEEAVLALGYGAPDCVLLDETLHESRDGRLRAALSRYPAQTISPIIVSDGNEASRLAALRRGAFETIKRPIDPELLRVLVARGVERATLARTTRELVEEIEEANAELRGSRGQLQSRVEEATRELRAKVDELDSARRELEKARQQRDEFIHVIAHELGGPLTAVEGYAEMLGHHEVPAELHHRASVIIRSEIRRLARLAQDLTGSAETADQLPLQLAEHDLVELVQEQVEVARALTSSRGIHVEVPCQPLALQCDRDRLGQVIFNLLSNAIKYGGGGSIGVRLAARARTAELRVSNDGPPIPPCHRETIFQPHVRLTNADSGRISGRGLGLYVARQIAVAHGGTLRAARVGAGAEFVLRLPVTATRRRGVAGTHHSQSVRLA